MKWFESQDGLTEQKMRMVSLSAMNGQPEGAHYTSLAPHMGKQAAVILEERWHILGRSQAIRFVEWLLRVGTAWYVPVVVKICQREIDMANAMFFNGEATELTVLNQLQAAYEQGMQWEGMTNEQATVCKSWGVHRLQWAAEYSLEAGYTSVHDALRSLDYSMHLSSEFDCLLEENLVSSITDIDRRKTRAWDLGRAAFIVRLAYEAEMLTEEEGWMFLEKIYEEAILCFNTWSDFADSYICGRAVWNGGTDQCDTCGSLAVKRWLLGDESSPWYELSFR